MKDKSKWMIRQAAKAALAAAAIIPAASFADVKVTFVEPERYYDASRTYAASKDEVVLKGLRQHFEALGKRYLGPGQNLEIEVLDVDLAGRHEMVRASTEHIRVMRGTTDWPEIRFRYALKEGDKVVKQDEVKVMDHSYLTKPNIRADSDFLAYEKSMLDDWFRQKFGTPKPASAK